MFSPFLFNNISVLRLWWILLRYDSKIQSEICLTNGYLQTYKIQKWNIQDVESSTEASVSVLVTAVSWLLHSLASEQLSYLFVFTCRQVLPARSRKTRFTSSIVPCCHVTFKLGFWFPSLFIPKVALPVLTFYDCEGCISKITKWLFQIIIFFLNRKFYETQSYFGKKKCSLIGQIILLT